MRRLVALTLLTASLSGCGLVDFPTRGELRVADFAYNQGLLGCIFGCDADEPLALDGNATVMVVNGDDLDAFHVYSDTPSVLEVIEVEGETEGWPTARVRGLAPGEAGLVVEDALTGEIVDFLVMQVHEVERIEVTSPDLVDSLLLTRDNELSLSVGLFDADGEPLVGVGAVTYVLDGLEPEPEAPSLELIVAEVIADMLVGTTRESVRVVSGDTLSAGTIEATVSTGARLDLPYAVVEHDVIETIELEVRGHVDVGEMLTVDAIGYTADGEVVHEPTCDWSVDAGRTRAVEISLQDAWATWEPQRHGRIQVTCATDTTETSTTVQVPWW